MTRRESRQEAFCLLFEKTFSDLPIEDIIKNATETRDLQVNPFTLDLAQGAVNNLEELDSLIEPKLKKWKMARISRVSLSVLRMAAYEMCHIKEVPISVTINEAVELTKIYSNEEDCAFVNGVLGSIAKDLGEKPDTQKAPEDVSKIFSEDVLEKISSKAQDDEVSDNGDLSGD